MDRLERATIIVELVKRLRAHGSWAGETHVQKAAYFLETLTKVPLGYEFILYRYGPFSFELRDDLAAMRADGLLEFRFQGPSYGPSLVMGESAPVLEKTFTRLTERYISQIEFVCTRLGSMGVEELERVGTALLVSQQSPDLADTSVAERVRHLKPHVTEVDAARAAHFVAKVEQEAREQLP